MPKLDELTPAEARTRVDAGEAVLIDVREPFEHRDEHIPGAHLVALSAFDPAEVARLAGDRTPIFQCRSGKRSADAAHRFATDDATVVHLPGALGVKEKELVALGIGLALRCERCIYSHAEKCVKAGATREAHIEVAGEVVIMQGGPGYVYMPTLIEALDELGV